MGVWIRASPDSHPRFHIFDTSAGNADAGMAGAENKKMIGRELRTAVEKNKIKKADK